MRAGAATSPIAKTSGNEAHSIVGGEVSSETICVHPASHHKGSMCGRYSTGVVVRVQSHPGDAWGMEVGYIDGGGVEGDPVAVAFLGALRGRHETFLAQDVELISAG